MMGLLKLMIKKLKGLKIYNERIRYCKIEKGLQKNCEVEFFDKDGDTIDVVMTPLNKLKIIESF